jgi:hypothetical protein
MTGRNARQGERGGGCHALGGGGAVWSEPSSSRGGRGLPLPSWKGLHVDDPLPGTLAACKGSCTSSLRAHTLVA